MTDKEKIKQLETEIVGYQKVIKMLAGMFGDTPRIPYTSVQSPLIGKPLSVLTVSTGGTDGDNTTYRVYNN